MIQKKWKVAFKIFGGVYFLFNLICMTAIIVLCAKSLNDMPPGVSPGWMLTLFPLLGVVAGYWLFRGYFRWFSVLVIISSLMMTMAGVFIYVAVTPKIEEAASHVSHNTEPPLDQKTQAFFEAVYEKKYNRIKALLDQGVDVNAKNHSQETALHLIDDEQMIRFLLERGADVHARNDLGMTPIFGRDIHLVQILIDAGADINARSTDGNTPFMWYCYSGYLEGMTYLVQQGADVNTCNRDGNNALYIVDHFAPNTQAFYYVASLGIVPCKNRIGR